MACFIVPVTEAVIVSIAKRAVKNTKDHQKTTTQPSAKTEGISLHRRLSWLSNMLWGGSALLAFEHLWHGEVVPWFPFLTAAANPEDAAVMLHEMATVGVMMAVLTTAVWGFMCMGANAIMKRSGQDLSTDLA